MVNLANFSCPDQPLRPNLMSDGSEVFPYLWRYFLSHQPLHDWVMRADPYATAFVSPKQTAQGIAYCCNFAVPSQWKDMEAAFDLGELFVPDHAYSHFMCGTVVGATSFHKNLVCALGPAASRHPRFLPSYQTSVRRMIIDTGSSRSINIVEFSWMQDGTLIVTAKILIPPDPAMPYQSAGCTGAFAFFSDVTPAGEVPTVPTSLVSFVEAPRCPYCIAHGSLGCYCSDSFRRRATRMCDEYSPVVWPPRIAHDRKGAALDTYNHVRILLNTIKHMAHAKITAHVVSPLETIKAGGVVSRTYKLGPSRFVIRQVTFRPSNSLDADTLRQVADKLRLLRTGSMSLKHALRELEENGCCNERDSIAENNDRTIYDLSFDSSATYAQFPTVFSRRFEEGSLAGVACGPCSKRGGGGDWTCDHQGGGNHPSKREESAEAVKPMTTIQDITTKVAETSSGIVVPKEGLACSLCGKTFSQQGSLNRHVKNIHEEKKIPCQFCNMSFGQMFDLKVS